MGSSILVFLAGVVVAGVAGAVYTVHKTKTGYRDNDGDE